jgi:hypothetical protein
MEFTYKGHPNMRKIKIIALVIAISCGSLFSVGAKSTTIGSVNPALANPSEIVNVYLPIIFKGGINQPQQFGVELTYINTHQMDMSEGVNTYWLRNPAISWELIEPVHTDPDSTYNWSSVNEWALQEASARGIQVIATVKYTPSWAQEYTGVSCGPIAEESLDEFAQFMEALVERYSAPPYNVKHWEIGNEPDVDHILVADNSIYGCWGEIGDPYYGGRYYGKMLKAVYQPMKNVDPDAMIHIGGLLLDCDPTDPYPVGKNCNPGNFLEGILLGPDDDPGYIPGNNFDIVSFHGYAPYIGSLVWDETWFTWDQRGGVVLGKADFLREVMGEYGVDKPLMHSEAGLLCDVRNSYCNPPGTDFYEAQADYVVWVHVRNMAADIEADINIIGTIWYTLNGPGWQNSGLLDSSQNPRPAYYSFQFMAEELRNADYIQRILLYYSQYPFLRVYEFNKSGKRIWVMWASDEQPSSITLPNETTKVFNKYGEDITPTDLQITVKSPIYVELIPIP